MTRTEQIQAAKAFTEKHKDSHRVFLEEGYIEASAYDLDKTKMLWDSSEIYSMNYARISKEEHEELFSKIRIWAIDQNGIATTDY